MSNMTKLEELMKKHQTNMKALERARDGGYVLGWEAEARMRDTQNELASLAVLSLPELISARKQFVSVSVELEALKATADCQWCGDRPTRAVLDGDRLCQSCCDKWARGQRDEVR